MVFGAWFTIFRSKPVADMRILFESYHQSAPYRLVYPIRTIKILRALRGLIFFRNRPLQASLFELRPDRSLKAPRTQSNYTGLGAWLRHQQTNKCSPKYICDCRCFSINCPQGIGTLFESKHQPALHRLVYPIRTKKTFASFAPSRFNLHAIVTASASVACRA
jgi:hypothetical protein